MLTVKEISLLFSHVAQIFLGASVLMYALRFRHLPVEFKVLGIFLIIDASTELAATWTLYQRINNLPLLHIYTLLEFVSLSLFYRAVFASRAGFQRYFWPFVGVVSALVVANSIFLEPPTGFNSNAKTLVQIALMGYAVFYFFNAYGKTDFSKPRYLAQGLVNTAVLLYNAGSLFIFMFAKILAQNKAVRDYQNVFWMFNAFLFLIFQLLVFIAIWKAAFRQTKSSS
jgi:hypothetical protein